MKRLASLKDLAIRHPAAGVPGRTDLRGGKEERS